MELIDLSHTVEHGMTTYPGLPSPVITDHWTREESASHYDAGTSFHIGRIDMIANTGTYLDTPAHRYADGHDLAHLPLDNVAHLPGVVVEDRGPAIGPDAIEGVEVDGRAILFATGWDRHWRTEAYGNEDHPFLTAGLVEALVDGGARLVGIDSVNIDDTRGGARPAHSGLLAADIPIVEHLTGLSPLAGRAFRFFAIPVKVLGMGTFPVRAFALADD